ncbi:MAG: 50S ribosomal protein L10 [Candidatus Zixiibacteriota bacterium]
MPRPEKVQLVAEVTEQFRSAGSVYVTDYAGLTVGDITELRKQLRAAGVKYRVVKNTLLRRAAGDAGLADLVEQFKGPTAVAFGPADPVAAAKIFGEFAARLEKPKVRRFLVDKKPYAATDLRALASLPSRGVLLAQVVGAVEGPIAGFIGTLDAIIRELVGTVDAMAKMKGEAAEV